MTNYNPTPVLLAIYSQIHDHLRESGKKRDQVIAFYLVVLVALLGGVDKLEESRNAVIASAWLVGLVSFAIVTKYWTWHVIHNGAMVAYQRLMLEGGPVTLPRCRATWDLVNDVNTSALSLAKPLRGVESATIYLLATLTLLPGYFILKSSGIALYHPNSDAIALVLNWAWYVPLLVMLSALHVAPYHAFREDTWPFRWLREQSKPTPSAPAG